MNIFDYTGTEIIEWDTSLPTLSGTATTEIGKPGATATIFVGNKEFVVPVDPLTGKFSITLTEPVPNGDYSVAIRITDKAGNVGAPFLRTLRVDTLPPDAPDLLNLFDDQNNQQGSFDPGQTVDDKRPQLTGIAQKGTTVYLRDEGNNIIGSTQADPISGKWVIEPDINLNDGVNKLTLVAEETFHDVKRLGAPSAPFTIVIGEGHAVLLHDKTDTSDSADNVSGETIASHGEDNRTQAYVGTSYLEQDTSLPTISGIARTEINKPGAVALLSVGGKYIELPVDPKTGAYSWTATEAMPDGDYSVYVAIRDRAGNIGKPKLQTLRIDTTPPDAPDLINLYDDQGLKTGSFDAGQTTDDTRPTLTGVAQPGTTVFLRDENGNTLGSAQADKITGKWVLEPTIELKEGINTLNLVAQEEFAGKTREGKASASFTIEIGADAPILPPNTITINDAVDDVGTWTGKLSSGALTDDTTPTLRGDVSAGNTVTVYYRLAGSQTWTGSATATVNGNEWSWTPLSALPYGEYEFQASIGDYSSSLFALDISTAADIVKKTVIESVKDDFGTWQGDLSSGAITDDATPTFSGRGEANGKVVLRFTQPGQPENTVTLDVDSSGHWTWTPASDLLTGNWNFNVQPLGETNWSETFALIITGSDGFKPVIDYAVDDLPPGLGNLTSGSTTNDTTPTLHGRAEANSVVVLRYSAPGQTAVELMVNADSSGHWSWTPPTLPDNTWTFEVQKAGQVNWNNFTLDIKSVPDRVPTIEYADDNFGLAKGPLYNGANTDDTTPTLHGTGPANSTIVLRYGTGSFSSVTVNTDSNGNWTWQPVLNKDMLWTFQVKNINATSWGSAFDLYVTGPLMTRLDFENGDSVYQNGRLYEWPDIDATFSVISSGFGMATGRTGNSQYGNRSLYIGVKESIMMQFGNHSGNKLASEFSFDFQSNSTDINQNASLAVYIIDNKGGTHNLSYYADQDVIRNKHVSITSNLLNGNSISFIRITSFTANHYAIIDNITWKYPNALFSESSHEKNVAETSDVLIDDLKDSDIPLLFPSELQQAIPDASKAIIQAQASTFNIDTILIDGERNLLIDDNKIQMIVLGGEEDGIKLQSLLAPDTDVDNWIQQAGTITVAGVQYDVYSHGEDAELLVQQGVKTELV